MELIPNKGTPTLVELNNQHAGLTARLVELGGELTPETEKELDELLAQLCTKTDGYGIVLKQLENNVEFWKQQKNECAVAQKVYENAVEALRSRMKYVLAHTEGESLQGSFFRFFLAKAADKVDIALELLPPSFKKTELVVTADREKVYAAIKKGETLPGVTVTENKALRTGRPK